MDGKEGAKGRKRGINYIRFMPFAAKHVCLASASASRGLTERNAIFDV